LINGYGPTEATTFTCCHEIGLVSKGASVPIGRPIANTEAYVLGERLELLPVGVNGELYVGGDGLARGYLNRAELTAERFVPHPYARRAGERLYRTGDVVRYLGNGELEFVGRRDAQVKVRGFRIELGEIETVLSQHAQVREAVAVVREPRADEKQLVAYVAGEAAGSELRRYLKEKLPEYMVPQLIVKLDALPLTASGKVDRQALPAPEQAGEAEAAENYVGPRTPEEELLASIWAEVLGVDRVSVQDNFFERGGHSLLATQVVSRVRALFRIDLPLRVMFDTVTLAELAQFIVAERQAGMVDTPLPAIERRSHDTAPARPHVRHSPVKVEPSISEVLSALQSKAESDTQPQNLSDVAQRLRTMFDEATLAQLAQLIVAEQQAATVQTAPVVEQPSQNTEPAIERRSRDTAPMLSYAQQRLWFLDQFEPGSSFYNVPMAIYLKGELDSEALAQSLTEIARRHEVLRTSFPSVAEQPVQLISPPAPVSLPVIDLQALTEASRAAVARRLGEEETVRPFDLAHGPVWRVKLLRLGEQEHVMLLTIHHIATDGWSMGLLMRELSTLYGTYSRKEPSPLPELTIQYADFAVWQREWLSGAVLEEQRDYWRRQLTGAPTLELPTDHVRPAIQSYRGGTRMVQFSEELTRGLRELSRREGVTMFMTLLSGWLTLLARYSGQWDISVGTPIANRTRGELEQLIGFFVNTLVLRTRMKPTASFREQLQQVREVCLGAYAHQDVPFEMLVEELQPERDMSRSPLFQMMFVLQNAPDGELEFPGLKLESLPVDLETIKFDLTLTAVEAETAILTWCNYSTDLFEEATVARMLEHWQVLLEAAVAEPKQSLSALPLLTEVEQQQWQEWNETSAEYPRETCIHELFEQQVERTPAATAVIFGAEELSYNDLNRRANQLAHYLRKHGVSAGEPVGLCLERSPEMVVGMLGVLKAGGGCVPIDPEYPRERVAQMLVDSGIKLLLTQQQLVEQLPEHSAEVVRLDADWNEIARYEATNLPGVATAENLAYMIYTSGSTGQPKGVMVPHRALGNHMAWMQQRFPLTTTDRVIQKTPFSFDASVWEFYAPLLVGAQLVIAAPGGHADPRYLVQLIKEQEVTILQLVPTLLERLLEEAGVEQCVSLRRMFCGGEALSLSLAERFREKLGAEFCNLYGPTEVTIDATYWVFESGRRSVPIGKPVSNTQAYVLDEGLRVTPIGVPGELYLGGESLAHGYWRQAELTAERFVPHPFSTTPGARLYRTGDLVRWNAAGELEYLGRDDQQVKVRGYRIETGEIETVLSRHADVREAVVVVREKQLVAYVVGEAAVSELRNYLKEKLPNYMMPQLIVKLEQLPLTANGKIDRQALPTPDGSGEEIGYVAPRTPEEELLAGIWSEVLGIERVSVHDNFFERGGHSLLATQVTSRIRTVFKLELPLRKLFERPTVAELAEHIETMAGTGQESGPAMVRVSREEPLLLSFAQQRLWFLDQFEPESPLYNVPSAIRLGGELDSEALAQSLSEIARRHEVLRTSFPSVDGEPVQLISPPSPVSLPLIDLQALTEVSRAAIVRQLVAEEAARPFDLAHGPVWRVTLLRLAEHEHALLLSMHHIVTDGWSVGVLMQELTALYEAYSRKETSPLPELPVQYADFAVWQREWLSGAVLEEQMNYWRERLTGAITLELPADHVRPPVQSYRGAVRVIELSEELTRGLRELSRGEGVTMFMTLLSGWLTLLARYSGQWDISVGTPIANRMRDEVEGLIGFFVNTLVLRTQMKAEMSFREQLQQVREVCLGAYAHQDVPFEMLVEELQPERDLSRSPLFQVMFVMQNAPLGQFELPAGLTLEPLEGEQSTTKFDLTLATMETETGLVAWCSYKTDLFEETTVERMLDHWQVLLEAAVAEPEQSLSALPLLTEAEQEQLQEWNDTSAEYPRKTCIHELFERQVKRTPAATAVIFGAEELSYNDLNRRANQLAHYLRKHGVSAGEPVGLCLERSPEMVVGMLGVLKAGGGYVPIDPEYPRERVAQMLVDSGIKLLLTQQPLVEQLPEHSAEVVRLDEDWNEITQYEAMNLPGVATAENLAYMIYTSGSTGQPKGVMVPHRALGNHMAWMQQRFPLTTTDRVIQKTPFSFDASVWEMFAPLLVGARLVMAAPGGHRDVAYLARFIKEQQITALKIVPSLLEPLLEESSIEECVSLRYVFCGAEAMPVKLAEKFFEKLDAELFNLYGPTETAIDVTYWACEAGRRSIPIGGPIINTTVYVLDEQLRLVPIGVRGELYVGGASLAHGYWQRADLTAERFVPNPYSTTPGARLYRTGDLVRWNRVGELEYLGRNDYQVKIRGFRIETGEIETVLSRHADVREAVVVIREKQLVAYVVGEAAGSELRRYLKEQLPEYMVPQLIVKLESLPLTASGKVDRRALPAPERAGEETGYVAPRTPEEELLAGIWSEVLGVERVSVHDNFFERGGHSLLATQVTSRIRTVFKVDLPLRKLFERPTVAELAQEIDAMARAGVGQDSVPAMVRVSREAPLLLSFAQQRLWFLHQLEPHSAVYNMHSSLHIRGPLNITAFRQTVDEIIRRHEVLRTIFVTREGEPVQIVTPPHHVLSIIDLRHLQEEERETEARRLATREARQPFNLAQGPLFRMILMRLSEESHVVAFTMHHIISDGWSTGLLITEMTTLYESFSRNEASPLPELSLQYADFAHWQREWLQGEILDTQLAYWEKKLAGAPAMLELPADRPRPATQTYRGANTTFEFSGSLSNSLKELSRAEGATLFMTLLAAFNVLLYRYTNQDDILVGTDIANRNHREIEPLLGFFINQLVMRTNLSGDPTFRELLGRVRETSLEAYAHQDLPFEKLVEALQPERHLSRSPLFQTKLLLQNFPTGELDLQELTLTPLDIEKNTATFDLTLAMTDVGDYLGGLLQYSTELFDESTVKRMLKHYETLLESIVANPERRISELSLLSETELGGLLEQSVGIKDDYPKHTCIHELFEAQAERAPNAPAVVFEDQELNYRELNRRANQLAHHLRSLGVGEDMLVGLCVERSVEMIVAVLGILKAGSAFLPLDPTYPLERIAFMLEDARVAVLLTQERLAESLPSHWAQVVCLDSDSERIAAQSSDNPVKTTTAENLAYVIYTSGSTGKPKGVMIEHAGICNLSTVQTKAFDMRPESRVLQFASLSFDASVWEIFMTLPAGGRLVMGPQEAMLPGGELEALLRKHEVTTATLPPTVLRVLDERQEKLAVVIAAGESLDRKTAERWRKRSNGGRLIDAYGPTEMTVCATMGEVETEVPTIGKPIANNDVYILDERMQAVPVGVTGELYLGGAGIARGYLNRPELTAEKFVPNPFGSAGSRVYRTGDLGRWLVEGEIEFVGRIDHQVKVRGYRIETGEIETLLNNHPDIETSLVTVREDVPNEKQLVAYCVTQNEEHASSGTLKTYLHESLPDYMIPSHFVMLDALPLTPNGKVDRGALPAPDEVETETERHFVAPRNATEELLAGIWSQVLRVAEVGIHDNFFELGGDSILSIQIITRANHAGLQLTTRQVFQHQTIAELAAHAGTGEAEEAVLDSGIREPFAMISAPDRARIPAGVEDAYPLAMMQAGMIFHSEFTPEAPLYHSISTFNVRAPFDADALIQSIADLAAIHEVMRTSIDLANFSEPLQLVHQHVEVPVGITDLRDLDAVAQEEAITQWLDEENRSFSWGEVPMVRFHLHRRTDDTFQFTFTAHHAIFDGWSDGLFLTELFQRYLTLIKDTHADELAPLASRYRDFVALERATLDSADARAYWRNLLSESKPTRIARWPQNKVNAEQSFEVAEAGSGVVNKTGITIDERVSQGLRELARRAGVPLKSVLLAAHLRVLSVISGERDIVTGLVSNGRPETTDGDRIIGLFLNTLPFRLSLDGGTWEELVTQVFRAERELLPYRRYPLSQIQRENGGRALFDTCFNYVHFHVLESIADLKDVEVLSSGGIAETNFALMVNFNLRTQGSEIDVGIACDDAKISEEQTHVIAGYYQRLLEAMAEVPEGEHYERHAILSEAQQHKLLIELNQTTRAYPKIAAMQRLFEAQVEQAPEATALVCGDDRVTYSELNERANQLAHHLAALGIGAEHRAGILLERSTALVVSMLAVLKAGGCYVPLDPQYPAERLSFMMKDAGLTLLLTTRALAESLNLEDGGVKLVYVEEQQPNAQNTENPNIEISEQQLAYLIYTSGSTGVPKGVAIAHESATRFIQWAGEIFEPQALSGVLFSTSVCFDLSIFELFVTLSNGGKVILAENAMELPALPAASEVTLLNTVPSAMAELLRLGAVPESVRVVNLAGEPLSKELVAEIYATTGVGAVYNLYGPSEDTTYSTFAQVRRGERVTIGRPIANTRVYLLDESGQCVPMGVAGELYLGGAGLARGYWDRPELTAEKFIPDSFSGEQGARLYHTGDLARYAENGELEFLGRADHQVKVRGYRIELGEIESVLRQQEEVREAVVVAREDASGAQQLVAYVVKDTSAGSVELREQLRQHLPEYMVPSVFVMLAELPLTPNGKVDRKALPAIDDSRPETVESYVAPRDMVEFQLVKLWEELLPVRPIGVRDNFFALGGHSLVAVRLVSRIEQELGKKIPIRALFQGATIEYLAGLLRQGTEKIPRIVQLRSGRKLPFICVHPAGGSIFNYLNLARHLDPSQPLYALQASGMDEGQPAHETIEAMAADYISAIREAGIEGPYLLGGWSMGGVVAFEMARQLRAEGEEVAGLSLIDSKAPTSEAHIDETSLLVGFAQNIGLRGGNVDVSPEKVAELNTEEKLALILNRAKQEHLLPLEVELADIQRYFNVYRANMRALTSYSPQAQRVRITLFKAAEHAMQNGKDGALGWDALTEEKVEVCVIPGNHYTLLSGPHVGVLAEHLQAWLNKAEGVFV
jgi:amino acid adenylation domain-containing protein